MHPRRPGLGHHNQKHRLKQRAIAFDIVRELERHALAIMRPGTAAVVKDATRRSRRNLSLRATAKKRSGTH
jgi:hypothetical protein